MSRLSLVERETLRLCRRLLTLFKGRGKGKPFTWQGMEKGSPIYPVVSRGNRREDIFLDDVDP